MNTVMTERPERVSMKHACHALTLNRSTVYARRHRAAHTEPPRRSRRYAAQPRALSEVEQATVIDTLHSEAYCDQPPAEAYQRPERVNLIWTVISKITSISHSPRRRALAS
jgi:hypothetical protein